MTIFLSTVGSTVKYHLVTSYWHTPLYYHLLAYYLLFKRNLGISVVSISTVLFLVSKLCTLPSNPKVKTSAKSIIKAKYGIDYIFYGLFLLLKPRTSRQFALRSMWKNSKSGFFLTMACILGGFLLFVCYKKVLLSFLTVPSYEKPLKNIPGKYKNYRCHT